MARTYKKDDSIITLDDLFSIGLPKNSELDDIHRAINDRLTFGCQLQASSPADAILNIGSSEVQLVDGRVQRLTGTSTFSGATINPVTGATTGSIVPFSFPTATAGQYVRMGLSLNTTGELVVTFNTPGASLGGDNVLPFGFQPIGFVDLESLGGTSWKGEGAATNIVENEHITQFLASGGAGQGGGGVSIQPASGFLAALEDDLDISPNDPDSNVSSETSAKYQSIDPEDSSNGIFELSCDKSVSITTVGTTFSLSALPNYTISAGDIIYSGGEFRKVDSLVDQQNGQLDVAFPSNLTAASGMVSQAVWTKNLVQLGGNSTFANLFGTYDHNLINIDILDSYALGDLVANLSEDGAISYAASNSGLIADVGLPLSDTFGSVRNREAFNQQVANYPLLDNTNKERLFVVFFASPTNPSVTTNANLLQYKVSAYEDVGVSNGGFLNTAYCILDGTGTPLNCFAPIVVFDVIEGYNVTEIELGWDFVPGVAPTEADGDIDVILEGFVLPRKFAGISGDWWKPVPGSTRKIRLSQDFSPQPASLHVRRRQGNLDNAPENALKLVRLNGVIVGNVDDVNSGVADFDNIQDAINAVEEGGKVTLLARTFTGNVTWDKRIFMSGQGNDSVINGTVNFSGTASKSAAQLLKFGGNIDVALGIKGLILSNGWLGNGITLTDNNPSNTDSLYLLVEEV